MVDSLDRIISNAVYKAILEHCFYSNTQAYDKAVSKIEEFKRILKVLKKQNRTPEEMKSLAIDAIQVQRALKNLKDAIPENQFFMFYKRVIDEQSYKSLSVEYGVDIRSIKRAEHSAIRKLSLFLYPELVLTEIFTVGW